MTYEDYPGGEMNFNKNLLAKMADILITFTY